MREERQEASVATWGRWREGWLELWPRGARDQSLGPPQAISGLGFTVKETRRILETCDQGADVI